EQIADTLEVVLEAVPIELRLDNRRAPAGLAEQAHLAHEAARAKRSAQYIALSDGDGRQTRPICSRSGKRDAWPPEQIKLPVGIACVASACVVAKLLAPPVVAHPVRAAAARSTSEPRITVDRCVIAFMT